jgi:hypothetical protein
VMLGANAARDLVDALTDLLNQQNTFLGVWVDYEAERMALDFKLGTMQLDARGIWIDPGEIGPEGPVQAAPPVPDFEGATAAGGATATGKARDAGTGGRLPPPPDIPEAPPPPPP